MFTIAAIKNAHAKVKSGVDFPDYIADLKQMGIEHYDHYVSDGRIVYTGADNYSVTDTGKYAAVAVAPVANNDALTTCLKLHQSGGSDYPTFCRQAADAGVDKWTVDMTEMTCAYYNANGQAMLTEIIPGR